MDMLNLMPKERPRLKPCCKHRKAWLPGTLDSVYRGDFIEKEVPVERALRNHDGHNLFNGNFDGTTTNGADFKPYETKREGPIRPVNTNLGGDLPFQGNSTYAQDFAPKEAAYHRVRPQHAFQPSKDPLQSETTNRADFMPRELPLPAKAVTHGTSIPTSAGPFAGSSLYKDTFQKHPYAKRQPILATNGGEVIPNGAFDDGTLYRTSFVPKEISRQAPLRPADARPNSSHGWYGGAPSTEYRGQFPSKEVPTREPIRMTQSLGVFPSGPFDGMTNSRADYKPYEVKATQPIRPRPAIDSGALPFQGESTYSAAFIPMDVPYQRVRPKNGFEPNSAPFDGTTTHKAAFIPMEVQQAPRAAARRDNIGRDQHPFAGSSTYKDDFTKMPGGRQRLVKPNETQRQTGPFDGSTTYNCEYVPKEIPARQRRRCECDEDCVDGIPGVTCADLL